MGILSGAVSARALRVVGDVPDGYRGLYKTQLNENAFRELLAGEPSGSGWALADNFLDTDFDDPNRWRFEPYVIISYRVDKKQVSAKRMRAEVAKRCEAWALDHGTHRCPASAKADIREMVLDEMTRTASTRTSTYDLLWNVDEGMVYLEGSPAVMEDIRKLFFKTFGLRLVVFSPLDWLAEVGPLDEMLETVPSAFGGAA
jgi:hypothetical protein